MTITQIINKSNLGTERIFEIILEEEESNRCGLNGLTGEFIVGKYCFSVVCDGILSQIIVRELEL